MMWLSLTPVGLRTSHPLHLASPSLLPFSTSPACSWGPLLWVSVGKRRRLLSPPAHNDISLLALLSADLPIGLALAPALCWWLHKDASRCPPRGEKSHFSLATELFWGSSLPTASKPHLHFKPLLQLLTKLINGNNWSLRASGASCRDSGCICVLFPG